MADTIIRAELSENETTESPISTFDTLPNAGEPSCNQVDPLAQRPARIQLSEEEVLKRMEEFPLRKEKFVAAVREGKNRNIYP